MQFVWEMESFAREMRFHPVIRRHFLAWNQPAHLINVGFYLQKFYYSILQTALKAPMKYEKPSKALEIIWLIWYL